MGLAAFSVPQPSASLPDGDGHAGWRGDCTLTLWYPLSSFAWTVPFLRGQVHTSKNWWTRLKPKVASGCHMCPGASWVPSRAGLDLYLHETPAQLGFCFFLELVDTWKQRPCPSFIFLIFSIWDQEIFWDFYLNEWVDESITGWVDSVITCWLCARESFEVESKVKNSRWCSVQSNILQVKRSGLSSEVCTTHR